MRALLPIVPDYELIACTGARFIHIFRKRWEMVFGSVLSHVITELRRGMSKTDRWLPKQQFVCGTGELHTCIHTFRRCLEKFMRIIYSVHSALSLSVFTAVFSYARVPIGAWPPIDFQWQLRTDPWPWSMSMTRMTCCCSSDSWCWRMNRKN